MQRNGRSGLAQPATAEKWVAGRSRTDRWRQRLVHRLGGPEQVPPLFLVALGFAALGAIFAWRHGTIVDTSDKLVETLIVVATAVLLAGLIQVLTAFVRWWSTRGERGEFYRFFGDNDVLGVVPDLSCTQMVVGWDPPGSDGATPNGTNVVPFQDLRAAISLAELFEQFDIPFKIIADTPYRDGSAPVCGFVAIGLGFNKLTCMLSAASDWLFEIVYKDTYTNAPKDDFLLDGQPHGRPDQYTDYALIVRVPLLTNSKVLPTFVCAGRSASGTAAAGYFLKNRWPELCQLYATNGKDFDDDALAVELEYRPRATFKAKIGRHKFGNVNEGAPRREAATTATRALSSVRYDGTDRRRAAHEPGATPGVNGTDTGKT